MLYQEGTEYINSKKQQIYDNLIKQGRTPKEARIIATVNRAYDNLPIEAFADCMTATINNPEGLENIKKYFPKSYKIFKYILHDIIKNGSV